jgi:AAA15 family ATPase/GTPase
VIKSFIFENFKSFDDARLDLENLIIMIGSNAAGKTNAIEGIKILSEIASGRDFSAILDGSKNIDSDIRGGSKGCCKFNSNYFKLGCIVELDNEFDLVYSIRLKVANRIYVEEESVYKISSDDKRELVFKTKKAVTKDSEDIKVEYNNGVKGTNPDVFCIRSSSILSQIVNKMSSDYKKCQENIEYVNMIINDLMSMLFLNMI